MVISYISGPISAVCIKEFSATTKLSFSSIDIISPIAFILISLLFYWSGWPQTGHVDLMIYSGLLIYLFSHFYQRKERSYKGILAGIWLIFYLIAIALLSYLGNKSFGGIGFIPPNWDEVAVVIAALIFYYWGLRSSWRIPILLKHRISKNL